MYFSFRDDESLCLRHGYNIYCRTQVFAFCQRYDCPDAIHSRQVDSDPDVRHYEPVMEVAEFVRNEVACVTYEDEIEDNMPDMLAGPIYNKNVLLSYTEADEEARKL